MVEGSDSFQKITSTHFNVMKKNCWEYKKCCREPAGANVSKLGVCPAATEWRVDGTHDGKNAGRICWIIAGTMCEGKVQGTFAMKYESCEQCDFYNTVKEEEGENFITLLTLLKRLKKIN